MQLQQTAIATDREMEVRAEPSQEEAESSSASAMCLVLIRNGKRGGRNSCLGRRHRRLTPHCGGFPSPISLLDKRPTTNRQQHDKKAHHGIKLCLLARFSLRAIRLVRLCR